jgi:hypothetical protein
VYPIFALYSLPHPFFTSSPSLWYKPLQAGPVLEIRPINTLTLAHKFFKWKRHTTLALKKKLEIIKLSEEGILKAEIGRKLDLLY